MSKLYEEIRECIHNNKFLSPNGTGEELVNVISAAKAIEKILIKDKMFMVDHFLNMFQGLNEDEIYNMISNERSELQKQLES